MFDDLVPGGKPAPAKAHSDGMFDDLLPGATPAAHHAPLGQPHITPTAPAPSFMQRVGDSIADFISPAAGHVGATESYTRGVMGGLHRTAGTVNLLALPFAGAADKIHELVSGHPQTGAQDFVASRMVDPEFHAAQDYDIHPGEQQGFGGKVAGAVGTLAPDLLAMLGTGGESAELGAFVKPVVERSVAGNVAHGVGTALEHSAKASLVPGIKAGVEQAQQHDAGSVLGALGDVLGGYEQTTATNTLPLAAGARPGAGIAEQILTKGAQGAVAMPAVSGTVATLNGQPYSLDQASVDAVLGSVMAQMGGPEAAPMGAAVDAAPTTDARAARAADALQRNASVLSHAPSDDLGAQLPPELLAPLAHALGASEPAQSAAALVRPDAAPAAQTSPVPAETPPPPSPAEPAGQPSFAQQVAASMRMRAQEQAARAPKTATPEQSDTAQPVAERAGSTPAAGDLVPQKPGDIARKRAPLNVRMGGQEYPVDSIEDASAKFLQLRDTVGDIGGMRAVELTNESGHPVGYIGHNGEVYEGRFGAADPRATPIFDPATPRRYGRDAIEPADDTPPERMDIRYGKKRATVSRDEMAARDAALQAKTEHYAPHEPVDDATHADPGEAPAPATPAVVSESIAKADANPRNLKEARGYLLDKIDEAIAAAPKAADMTFTKGHNKAATEQNRRDRLTASGHVTFDVPGDGKFKVVNTDETLADFRDKVARSPGFKDKQERPRGPQPPSLRPSAAERERVMAEAQTLGDDGEPIQKPNPHADGDTVKVVGGAFKGLTGRVSEAFDNGLNNVVVDDPKRGGVHIIHAKDLRAAEPEAAHADAQELTDADLSDSERGAFERLRVDRGGLRAKLSRTHGEADADGLRLREAVHAAVGHSGVKVEYLRGQEGLPDRPRQQLQDQARARNNEQRTSGLYVPGDPSRVFVFTDVAKTPEKAAFTAAHEIAGHHGLRALAARDAKLGNRTTHKALDAALDIALQNPTVKAVADSMMRRRSSTDRLRMAEEALADLAAASRTGQYDEILRRHGVEVPQAQRATLRGAIARFVERVKAILGASGAKFTDAQVHDLLENAWKAAKEPATETTAHPPLESTEDAADFAPHAVDDLPIKAAGLPSRRPGEAQADYTRRVANKGGDELEGIRADLKTMRKVGRANFRAMLAKQARMGDVADAVFGEYRSLFDKADRQVTLDSIHQWETGQTVSDPDARKFFDLMDGLFADRIERLRAAKPGALKELVENYFPHIWEDTSKAEKWYAGNTKRPLDGNKSFLKQRTWGTIKEGMESGLRPVSYNPVDLALLKLGQMDKFITFNEFKNDLKSRGWLKQVKAGEKLLPGYALIDSPAFKGEHAFVAKNEDGTESAGTSHWNWAVPEGIAKDVNNYLGPSLYKHGAWKALRYVQNVLMSTRLGFSMFHAGFTTLDNAVTHGSIGLNRLLQGDIAGGVKELAYGVALPISAIHAPFKGGRLGKAWQGKVMSDPHTQALLAALEEGGARRLQTSQQQDFNNALGSIARKVRRLRAPGFVRDTEAGMRALLAGPKSELAKTAGKAAIEQASELLGAVGELSSWLIHQKLVPAQKMNARVALLKFELDRFAKPLGKKRGDYAGILDAMHPDAIKQVAGRVVDNVDDRLGQMNYDNQFWPKVMREVAQATIGAVGWQVGTVRTVTGGVSDLRRIASPEPLLAPLDKGGTITDANMGRLTNRVTNLLTLGLLMGGSSALLQLLLTGDPPEEPKDYFFPRTGRKNADGSDERLQFPSYWMDHFKLATHPLQTAEHKLHPSIGMAAEVLTNQDYYGVRIRDEDAGWLEQAGQVADYVAKGFVPYSITGQGKLQDSDASLTQRVGNFFGVTTAPASVSRTKFQAFVAEKSGDNAPRAARTQEQADHTTVMHAVEDALRRGEKPDTGDLTDKEIKAAHKAAELEVPALRFQRLSLEDKLRAWDMATPEERARYKLIGLIFNGGEKHWREMDEEIAKLPEEDQAAVREKLAVIQGGPAGGND